jgi:hypothetical protein
LSETAASAGRIRGRLPALAMLIGQDSPIMRSNTDTGNVKIFFIIVFFCIQPPVLDRGLFQYRRGEKDGLQVWYISQNGG